ncbi:MAG: YdcF family protein [Chloroflexi bacterium]|nr:YdcF family protein [Chloroflexota bacterium]
MSHPHDKHHFRLLRHPGWKVIGPGYLIVLPILIPLLAAPWLVVNDTLTPADAIVVLGGEGHPPNRTIQALALYRRGIAPVIVFAGGAPPGRPAEASSAYRSLQEALARGLSPSAALVVDNAQSTYDEAVLLHDLAARQGWTSLVVVTDPYHTRRSAQTFHTVIPEMRITVSAAPFLFTCADQFRCAVFTWRYASGELVKLVYYRTVYGVRG